MDSHGKPLTLSAVVNQARQAQESRDYAGAVGQARLGLTLLDGPGERDAGQDEAEVTLRLILAQAREKQGYLQEARDEYRWLSRHAPQGHDSYRAKVDQLSQEISARGRRAAQDELARARELAKKGQIRPALALAALALGELEEHRASQQELGRACQFLAEQHLALGETDRARFFFERAAYWGLKDPRLAGLSKERKVVIRSYQEERLDGSGQAVVVPGRLPDMVPYPVYQGGDKSGKPVAERSPTPPAPAGRPSPAPHRTPQRIVLPSLQLPQTGGDTLPGYNTGRGSDDTLPTYHGSDKGGTLPTYHQTESPR